MQIKPCCEGCGKPYVETKSIHPAEQNPETWLCQECAIEQAQVHQFDPDARRGINADRESLSNGEYAERGANAVCDYSGVCNPDDFNIADLTTDLADFCDREGHNIRAIIRRAIRNWEGER